MLVLPRIEKDGHIGDTGRYCCLPMQVCTVNQMSMDEYTRMNCAPHECGCVITF